MQLLISKLQAVAHPGLGDEEPGLLRRAFDLIPQPVHEYVQVLRIVPVLRSPNRLQEFAMSNCSIRMCGQVRKQIQLFRSKPHSRIANENIAPLKIDIHQPQSQMRSRIGRRIDCPSQNCANSGQ